MPLAVLHPSRFSAAGWSQPIPHVSAWGHNRIPVTPHLRSIETSRRHKLTITWLVTALFSIVGGKNNNNWMSINKTGSLLHRLICNYAENKAFFCASFPFIVYSSITNGNVLITQFFPLYLNSVYCRKLTKAIQALFIITQCFIERVCIRNLMPIMLNLTMCKIM